MAEISTYILLDRNIIKWRWYKDGNTMRLFIHLLMRANVKAADFEGLTIRRGQFVTSYARLSQDLGISVKCVRTALNHLKRTGEVAVTSYPKYSVITVLNYNRYQSRGQSKGQSKGKQRASKGQQVINDKERINNIPAAPVEYHDPYLEEWE